MKAITICALALAASAIGNPVSAGDNHAERATAKPAIFDKFKALEGTWEMQGGHDEHGGPPSGSVSYKVTAGGSAVMETFLAGSEHEMITLYYVEGDGMALTHYCMLGNRPHMRAIPSKDPNKITLRCPEGEDRALEAEQHMHQATFTFVDADHFKSEWTLYKDGKAEGTHGATFVRKKK